MCILGLFAEGNDIVAECEGEEVSKQRELGELRETGGVHRHHQFFDRDFWIERAVACCVACCCGSSGRG